MALSCESSLLHILGWAVFY
uniref:Uncharacterized protein n=1 Tax=Arundo donax TaxID=35708 RepID=A0A0A9ABE3_ARUDO